MKNINLFLEELSSYNYNSGLLSIYNIGSSSNPYITHKDDLDILFIYESRDYLDNLYKTIGGIKVLHDLSAKYNLDVHFISLPIPERKRFYDYELYYAKPLEGYQTIDFNINILENKEVEKNKLSSFTNYLKSRPDKYGKYLYDSKLWYHVYMILSILKNDSYELNEEQIKNVNMLHDNIESQERKELIDNLIKEVEEWQI